MIIVSEPVYFKDIKSPKYFYKVVTEELADCNILSPYKFNLNYKVIKKEIYPLLAYDSISSVSLLSPYIDPVSSEKKRLFKCEGMGIRKRYDGLWECDSLNPINSLPMPEIASELKANIAFRCVLNICEAVEQFQQVYMDFISNQYKFNKKENITTLINYTRLQCIDKSEEKKLHFSDHNECNYYALILLMKAMNYYCDLSKEKENFDFNLAESLVCAQYFYAKNEIYFRLKEIVESVLFI
jgi:hypothetical protein